MRAGTQDGIQAQVFRLKVQGVVGWIAPSIDVSYSERDHILLRYEGMADLRDKSGENVRADGVNLPAPATPPVSALERGAYNQSRSTFRSPATPPGTFSPR